MRVIIIPHAIIIASCFYFILCDNTSSESSASMVASRRQCICQCLLKEASSKNVAYTGNPENDREFLVCLKDGRVFTNTCPGGNFWNSRVGGCANTPMRKSFPMCDTTRSPNANPLPVSSVGSHGGSSTGPVGRPSHGTTTHGTSHPVARVNPTGSVSYRQQCVCGEALRRVSGGQILYRCDPDDASKFLACARGSVTVHSCPPNLFWNRQTKTCYVTESCSPVPPRCGGKPSSSSSSSPPASPVAGPKSHLYQSVAPIQRCICSEVLLRSGRSSISRCDPLNEHGYLLCSFGSIERKSCSNGQKWNIMKRSCSSDRKCLPVPMRCRFGAHMTTPPPPPMPTTTAAPNCTTKYTLYEKKLTWHFARLVCEANGAELAVILNNETQALLTEKYGSTKKKSYGGIWIGASDGGEEGKWRWVTGPLIQYSNWFPGQPSGYKYQHCMQFNYYKIKGAWDDTRCYYKKKFLCQKEECTTS